ncbi:MAG TPA: tRNA (N6-threonylcarbamoyladenosine(37)-N6)-methyltransferase TrmO [Vicinamibacterales bacterium]|jgi:tRNA-Thr(GGU) m(6)t(6)A37 methyltransferase TsaA
MNDRFVIQPIAFVHSQRAEVRDDGWDAVEASIELVGDFSADALAGLTEFSHAEILFVFDRVDEHDVERGARHPRGNVDWPRVGIFAQRAKNRPNRLGATVVRVLGVEGRTIRVSGLDAVDGTPVVDIKPVLKEFLPRGDVRQPRWVSELMGAYWS